MLMMMMKLFDQLFDQLQIEDNDPIWMNYSQNYVSLHLLYTLGHIRHLLTHKLYYFIYTYSIMKTKNNFPLYHLIRVINDFSFMVFFIQIFFKSCHRLKKTVFLFFSHVSSYNNLYFFVTFNGTFS